MLKSWRGSRCKVDGCDKRSQVGGKCGGHGGYSNFVVSLFKPCKDPGGSTSHSIPSGTVTTSLALKNDEMEPRQDESMKGAFGKFTKVLFVNSPKQKRLFQSQYHQNPDSSSCTPPRSVTLTNIAYPRREQTCRKYLMNV